MTISSALLAYNESKPVPRIVQHPSADEIQQASSVHVLAFTSTGELLVAESEGVFSYSEWDDIFRKAKTICGIETSNQGSDVDIEDEDEGSVNMQSFVRSALETKIEADLHWKSWTQRKESHDYTPRVHARWRSRISRARLMFTLNWTRIPEVLRNHCGTKVQWKSLPCCCIEKWQLFPVG